MQFLVKLMIYKACALIYLRKCDIIYKKEMIVTYHFTPPKKHKKIYILINVLIILLIISITAFFHDRIEIFGIPIALWCLFNGLWSVNANWYSWFHRNDKSSSSHGFWLICLITGLAMSILLLLIHLLMWFVTPFYCFYLTLYTFLPLFRKKDSGLDTILSLFQLNPPASE